ncbi:hypothetical protein AAMO2058_001723600 [Amorphochlora amoebiformis]
MDSTAQASGSHESKTRRESYKKTREIEKEEQTRRIKADRAARSNETLIRKKAAREADKAADDEQMRRIKEILDSMEEMKVDEEQQES